MAKRILLVDDEVHILRAAEFKFQRAGYDVRCAFDGEEAWQAIEEQTPDLIITDYQMPRLDGLGLVKRLRTSATAREIPVIMLTAKGFELSCEEVSQLYTITAVLAKPFSPRELLRQAEELMQPEGELEASTA